MKILVTEDDFCSRELLKEIMSSYGTVYLANNGREGVDAFMHNLTSTEPFDLICLDIMMPVMDGQEALKEIRRIEREKGIAGTDAVKIIMTTALSDSINIMQALMNGGCDAYINKPISADEIKNILPKLGFA